jgi:hypothetical protein
LEGAWFQTLALEMPLVSTHIPLNGAWFQPIALERRLVSTLEPI